MTRDQLEHAIRAACDVAEDTELLVFGSQAILGEHPDAPPELRASNGPSRAARKSREVRFAVSDIGCGIMRL